MLLFGDTGIDRPTYNNLLAGIGSSITFTDDHDRHDVGAAGQQVYRRAERGSSARR